jgi:hypothetical protein
MRCYSNPTAATDRRDRRSATRAVGVRAQQGSRLIDQPSTVGRVERDSALLGDGDRVFDYAISDTTAVSISEVACERHDRAV